MIFILLQHVLLQNNKISKMDQLDVSLIAEIIAFVGPKQYRFVATVDRRFHAAYKAVFPQDTWTHVSAITMEHAQISYMEGIATCNDGIVKSFLEFNICRSAAKFGNLPALQYLRSVQCGWAITTCDAAVDNGHLHILRWAKDHGCPWDAFIRTLSNNYMFNFISKLHSACRNGYIDIVRYVIEECHVDREWKDDDGTTALHVACQYGHLDVVQYLIEACHVNTKVTCKRGWTALQYATESGHTEVQRYLIEKYNADTSTEAIDEYPWEELLPVAYLKNLKD